MAYDIGPRIGIDGESEFRKQLNNINTSLKTLGTELDKVSSDFKKNANSEQALIAKNNVLRKSIDEQQKKIKEVEYALQQAADKYGENSNQALKWQQVLNRSKTALNNLESELQQNEQALDEMAQGLRDAETGLEKVKSSATGLERVLGENLGGAVVTGAKAMSVAIAGIGTALVAAAEGSREYRQNMGKLNTAFTTNDHSASAAKETYRELVGVLGESDRSVEAANHLAVLTDNEKDLRTWTNICTGVFATFGDSLPIEGLTEAANETAKVGKVTGPLADALNWAGISEDEFNAKLAKCSSEQERQKLIMDTLNGVYDEAAQTYKKTNKEVIEANKAQDRLNDAIARVGKVVEPVLTLLKNFAAAALEGFASLVEKIRELPVGIQAVIGGFVGLVAMIGPAVLAFSKITEGVDKFKKITGDIGNIFGKKAAATTADTVATTANTAATTANTKATGILAKAKQGLSKALAVGKWVALGAAIAGAGYLIYQFAKDSQAAGDMVRGFADKAAGVIGSVASMVPQIVTAIQEALPVIMEAGMTILMALMNGILQAIPVISEAIPQILIMLANGIIENLEIIINSALQIILALIQGFVEALPQLIAAIPMIINAILTGIVNNLGTIVNGALQIILALIQGLAQALPQLIAYLPTIIATIVTGLLSMIGQIFTVGVQILQRLWSGISSWVGSLYSKVTSFARQLPGKIKSGIGSLVSVGGNWVKGLWNGISDKVGWILDKIKGFGKSVLDGIKSIFGISSPSKEMAKIGGWFADGFDVGVTKEMAKVKKNIESTMKGTLSTAQRAANLAAEASVPAADFEKIAMAGTQNIYLDGRLVGRALRGPLKSQGVVIT